jgi:hypothetical protein
MASCVLFWVPSPNFQVYFKAPGPVDWLVNSIEDGGLQAFAKVFLKSATTPGVTSIMAF